MAIVNDRSDWWRPGDAGTSIAARPAVRVLSVAAPTTASRASYGAALGAAGLWIFALLSLISAGKVRPPYSWPMFLLGAQGLACCFFAWTLTHASLKEYREVRRRQRDQPAEPPPAGPRSTDDQIADAIRAKWQRPDRPPKPADILETVRSSEPHAAGGARLICLNVPEVPPAGDFRFEPEIIAPIRSLAFPLGFAALGLLIVIAWFMQFVPGVPWRFDLWGFPCILIPAAVFGVLSLWALWVRPTYVRCAPGVIQVLCYSWRGGPPRVRSYPMEPGTLAVVTRKGDDVTLALFRNDLRDALSVSDLTRPKEAEEIVWKSLRSTAPIPPLDDSQLVG
jgi:hypothetical protein